MVVLSRMAIRWAMVVLDMRGLLIIQLIIQLGHLEAELPNQEAKLTGKRGVLLMLRVATHISVQVSIIIAVQMPAIKAAWVLTIIVISWDGTVLWQAELLWWTHHLLTAKQLLLTAKRRLLTAKRKLLTAILGLLTTKQLLLTTRHQLIWIDTAFASHMCGLRALESRDCRHISWVHVHNRVVLCLTE